MAVFRILHICHCVMVIAGLLSPHDDLVKAVITSSKGKQLQEAFGVIIVVINFSLDSCLSGERGSNKHVGKSEKLPRDIHYCALLKSQYIKTHPITVVLNAEKGYIAKTAFLQFDLPWTGRGCPKLGLQWLEGHNGKVFCGYRYPWIEYSQGDSVKLSMYGTNPYMNVFGFSFYIFYNMCRVCKFTKHVQHTRNQTVFSVSYDSEYAVSESNTLWHIFAAPGYGITVIFTKENDEYLYLITVYSGPGPKAAQIVAHNATYGNAFISKTSHAYIVNRNTHNNVSLIFKYYVNEHPLFRYCDFKFPTYTQYVIGSPFNISIAANKTHTVDCSFQYETNIYAPDVQRYYISLSILDFVFNGPDTVSEYIDRSCQYGGLFFYALDTDIHVPVYELCNTRDEYTPDMIAVPSNQILGVFQWYQGYSHGHVSAILHVTQCVISQLSSQSGFFSWPGFIACQQFEFIWSYFIDRADGVYNLTIMSSVDALLGPSTLSSSLTNSHSSPADGPRLISIMVNKFNQWPSISNVSEVVIMHDLTKNQSQSRFVSFLANLTIEIDYSQVDWAWYFKLKLVRYMCHGIMMDSSYVDQSMLLITKYCSLKYSLSRNTTFTFLHSLLSKNSTYITVESGGECEQRFAVKDEVVESRDLHRRVVMTFSNTRRVSFRHEIYGSHLKLTLTAFSARNNSCAITIRVTPSDLTTSAEKSKSHSYNQTDKRHLIFHNKRSVSVVNIRSH